MIRGLMKGMLLMLLSAPLVTKGASIESGISGPEQVVSAFQKLPHYEMFCKDKTWGGVEPIKVGAKFKSYLSQKFFKLFLWSQCVEPDFPPRYFELDAPILWEIRYGFTITGLLGEESIVVTNVRVQSAKFRGTDTASVKVLYDFGTLKNLPTTYTVNRENGQWKIDDIAPKGDYAESRNEDQQDSFLRHSKSIKTEMQRNYRKAEVRYQQEQTKKRVAPKP